MPLIKQIYQATQSGELLQPFTTEQLKSWMSTTGIVKDDGSNYAQASIDAILSNSDTANSPTTNKNRKTLSSTINTLGNKQYQF